MPRSPRWAAASRWANCCGATGIRSDSWATPARRRKPSGCWAKTSFCSAMGRARPGLVEARCCHRGTTLYYGRVEERGIRCCYHGWLFDTEGRCVEQPCEPEGGLKRDRVRQPWYPVQELYGLIFAYMGPPEKKPVLPRYECLEQLEPGEMIEADDSSIGSGGGVIVPCNWLQHYENVPDAFHVPILHGAFSGVQFVAQMGIMPKVKWEYSPTRRQDHLGARARRWARALPSDRGRVADAARRAQSAGRALYRRRVARLDAADRRHAFPHLRRRQGPARRANSAPSARA